MVTVFWDSPTKKPITRLELSSIWRPESLSTALVQGHSGHAVTSQKSSSVFPEVTGVDCDWTKSVFFSVQSFVLSQNPGESILFAD